MEFFTSDHHFFHANIVPLCNRPFANVDEMNNELVIRWNSVVKPTDNVRHIGDFAFTLEQVKQLLPNLNGKIFLTPGNHDRWVNENLGFDFMDKLVIMPPQYIIEFKSEATKNIVRFKGYATKNIMIVLNHYPMRAWQHSHHGSWHLYGHQHNKRTDKSFRYGLSFDVGVDGNAFTPVSLEQVIEEMNNVKTSDIPYPIYERRFGTTYQ